MQYDYKNKVPVLRDEVQSKDTYGLMEDFKSLITEVRCYRGQIGEDLSSLHQMVNS